MRIARVVVLIVLTATGCGGRDQASKPTAPPAPPGPVSSSSRLGCDGPSACSTVEAEETLKRCPASRLDARGRTIRERLVRLLRTDRAGGSAQSAGRRGVCGGDEGADRSGAGVPVSGYV